LDRRLKEMEESSGKFDMQVNENQTLLGKTDGNLMDDGLGKLGDINCQGCGLLEIPI